MLAPGGDTSGPFSAPAGTAAANVHGTGYLGLPLGVAPAPEGNSATAPTSPADSTAQTMRIIRFECTSPAFRGRSGPAFRGIGPAPRSLHRHQLVNVWTALLLRTFGDISGMPDSLA